MSKIEKLTSEQEAKIPEYCDRYINISLNTDPFTREHAESVMHDIQKKILDKEPTPVILMENIKEAWVATVLLNTLQQLENLSVERAVEIFREMETRYDFNTDEIKTMADASLTAAEKAGATFERQEVLDWTVSQYQNFVLPYFLGSFDAYIFAFYDFMLNEVGVEIEKEILDKYQAWRRILDLNYIFELTHVCVVCQKPTRIRRNEEGQLHSETGPAIAYGPRWESYYLNGVNVPKDLALTPGEDLTLDIYHRESNADVQAEFVRKYGVERMLEFGTKLDTYENYSKEDHPWYYASQYELWDMAALFDGLDYQPYLKMLNQTTGIWHVEPVDAETCRTIDDAHRFRNDGEELNIVNIV